MFRNKSGSHSSINGDLIVVLAMSIFGFYGIFLRLFPSISTLLFLFSFQLISFVILFLYLKIKRMPITHYLTKSVFFILIALSIVAVGNDLFYFYSFRLTSIANATITHQMVSVFLLIISPLFIQEKIHKNETFCFLVAFSGILLIFGQGIVLKQSNDILGITVGLLSAFCYSLLIILYRIIGKKNIPIAVVNFWRSSISIVLVLPLIAFGVFEEFQIDFILPILAFGIIFAVIASSLHNLGMMRARTMHVSIIGKSEPVFAIIYGMVFLKEFPSWQAILGGILILGSGLWLIASENRTNTKPIAI